MKNKILLSIIVILLPITIYMFSKKENIESEVTNSSQKDIYIHFLINNEMKELPLEEYLVNVVGAEVPALFDIEALKAQAIASRTFALYEETTRGYVTTGDQAYNSLETFQSKWQDNYNTYLAKIKKAVSTTKNLIMTYENNLIKSYFYAMSNGYTTTSLSVFNEELPYLNNILPTLDSPNTKLFQVTKTVSKTEFCDTLNIDCTHLKINNILPTLDSPNTKLFEVTKTISKTQFCKTLNIDCTYLKINNITTDTSNRVEIISINDTQYTGIDIRKKFNLRSTDFTIEEDNDNIVFTTKGYGHGVGMSQYGANTMAKNGSNYEDILKYYYQGVEIKEYDKISS